MNQQNDFLNLKGRHSYLSLSVTLTAFIFAALYVLLVLSQMMIMGGNRASQYMILCVATIITMLFHLIGLVFGLISLFSKKTKNFFPITASVFNGFFLLLGIAMFILLIIKGSPKEMYPY